MTLAPRAHAPSEPPLFEDSQNRRQRARSAWLDPNHWYPGEWVKDIAPGEVQEITFQERSLALFRDERGQFHAIENRCAHRHLPLTKGHVKGCNLVCAYHGWAYDGDGKVVDIPHTLFGKKEQPKFRVGSVPVKVRYGIVWFFPGDAKLAAAATLPEIPELEGPNPWPSQPAGFTWRCHHSMIMDNVCDFSHAYLHRKYRPFVDATLTDLNAEEDRITLSYDTQVGRGRISGMFINRDEIDTESMNLGWEYPYQWSDTGGRIKHWLFVRPIDRQNTRTFFIFYFDFFKVPLTDVSIPRALATPLLKVASKVMLGPLLEEDGYALEAEQIGWDRHWDAPLAELNPVVHAFHEMGIRKWQEYLDRQATKRKKTKSPRRRAAQEDS